MIEPKRIKPDPSPAIGLHIDLRGKSTWTWAKQNADGTYTIEIGVSDVPDGRKVDTLFLHLPEICGNILLASHLRGTR